jgi:hypothetical protein
VKQQIRIRKLMLTVIWGIDGFHVVDLVTEQHSYSTQYFPSHIFEPLLPAVFPDGRKSHSRRVSLHPDKCRVHRSKFSEDVSLKIILFECPIRLTVLTWHLLTSDFWFLGRLKAALQNNSSPDQRISSVAFRNF